MQTKITIRCLLSTKARALESGKPVYLWDTELRGFGAYASPNGTISWLVQKWQGGRQGKASRITIGRFPSLSLEEARQQARPITNEAYNGVDISAKKRSALVERISSPSIAEA